MSTMTDGYKANELRKRARELLHQADILDPPYPSPAEEDWRIVGPWGTQHRAVQDLEVLKALGFDDYKVEERL